MSSSPNDDRDTVSAQSTQPPESPETEPARDREAQAAPVQEQGGSHTGELIVLFLLALSFLWYLLADRYTPYTTQARIESYVVGIAPQVSGIVEAVLVDNNQAVSAGQPLFRIDSSQYRIALQAAQSQLDSTLNQVAAGDATVQSARAALEAALADRAKAEKDYSRLRRMYQDDPGTISVRRLEISQASLESAEARVDKARADIEGAILQKGGDDDQDNALLRAAQSAVDKAELDLKNTEMSAPIAGRITDLRTDVGNFAGMGTPVATLLASHNVWINAEYTENNLRYVRAGQPVEILFDAMPGAVFDGEVESVGLGVSAGRPPPPGALPSIENDRDWLRQAQRFPVVIRFDESQHPELPTLVRVGGQATVVTYTDDNSLLNPLGRLYIRMMSVFSYVY
ncbi:HlyD family secretion protein [Marinobacter sp. JSM 1782161]|uniref:HlyD family secretion protein n=1 Tax=Marinobacter sp. JSM 1782161 TaxID=2685906 RepID=UPI001403734C|nr:HlyD family secretion protein [Marinobacter sp. JSM 1782161]